MKTVVGLYNSIAKANQVKLALASDGFASGHITVIDQTGEDYNTGSSYAGHQRDNDVDTSTVGGKIKHFFSALAGGDDDSEHGPFARGVQNGGALLAVTVEDARAGQIADLLKQHGASEIEDTGNTGSTYNTGALTPGTDVSAGDFGTGARTIGTGTLGAGSNFTGDHSLTTDVAGFGDTGNNAGTTSVMGEQVIPVIEEELVVGKREVNRGGVRVYSHISERPVAADVTLRNERIFVDRRLVDREATDVDFDTDSGVVELTASGEEAVVGKRSRVVEEVFVGKQSSEHTEQVNDTVRRTEVEVEQIGTREGALASDDNGFATSNTTETKGRY